MAVEQKIPRNEIARGSRFPSAARGSGPESYGTIKISLPDPGLDQYKIISDDILQVAWALLMWTYSRETQNSFAIISRALSCDYSQWSTNGPFETSQYLFVYYDLSIDVNLRQMRPTRREPIHPDDLKASNTAVDLSGFQKHQSEDQEYQEAPASSSSELLQNCDLTLCIIPTGTSTSDMCIKYKSPAISYRYGVAIGKTFEKILSALSNFDVMNLEHLNFVTEADHREIMAWNPLPRYSQMACVHHLVDASIRVIPHAEAICSWDGSLSYAELDELSSLAAAQLIAIGVVVGDCIPFAFEKSLWTVVATLGILKAGAAFVPLDPTGPEFRLKHIIDSVKAKLVVTSDQYKNRLEKLIDTVVVISKQAISQQKASYEFIPAITGPHDPVFVLFTSGSTGVPKGMMLEHGAICTHAISHGRAMGYTGARVLQFAAHTFDVAIMDIFTTLIFGGCICIPAEESRMTNIASFMNDMRVDLAILTPLMAGVLHPSDVPTLKTLAVGGEALLIDNLRRWTGISRFIQIYGPAEVGICLAMDMNPASTLPQTVGYPISNCACWLVSPDNPHELVPIGAVGELVVSSSSLARCYVNDELRTSKAFIGRLAWADRLGLNIERFYRTGDLLRYNTTSFDGCFDFVGRKDHQIKLRGQRLEPGEVEHHISGMPQVAACIVVRPHEGSYANKLVAVLQIRKQSSTGMQNGIDPFIQSPKLGVEELRAHLEPLVPTYMIPSEVVEVTEFPTVRSLKIDRRAVVESLEKLEKDANEHSHITSNGSRRQLDLNESIAIALSRKIKALTDPKPCSEHILNGVYDFDVGCTGLDSIQIMSLAMFINREYGKDISLRVLLRPNQTVSGLAALIEADSISGSQQDENLSLKLRQECDLLQKALTSKQIDQVPRCGGSRIQKLGNILLTGSTGYLGLVILRQLLEQTDLIIYALVRCSDEDSGKDRLTTSATASGWWKQAYAVRLVVWSGDLCRQNLGLRSNHLDMLLGNVTDANDSIHAIIHNGAVVHYTWSYEALKPANVTSTYDLLDITARSKSISKFFFISGGFQPVYGTASLDWWTAIPATDIDEASGYAQTKLISDSLTQACARDSHYEDVKLLVFRPGYIIGSLDDGAANQRDFIWRLIAGCVEADCYCAEDMNRWVFIAGRDQLAASVVSSFLDDSLETGHVEQIRDGILWSDIWTMMRDDFGYNLTAISTRSEWMHRMRDTIMQKQEKNLLFPLLHSLERESQSTAPCTSPVVVDKRRVLDTMRSNIKHLIGAGFIPIAQARD